MKSLLYEQQLIYVLLRLLINNSKISICYNIYYCDKSSKEEEYIQFIHEYDYLASTINFIGMVSYSFVSSSCFILIYSISYIIIFDWTFLGFDKKKLSVYSLFVPSDW